MRYAVFFVDYVRLYVILVVLRTLFIRVRDMYVRAICSRDAAICT